MLSDESLDDSLRKARLSEFATHLVVRALFQRWLTFQYGEPKTVGRC